MPIGIYIRTNTKTTLGKHWKWTDRAKKNHKLARIKFAEKNPLIYKELGKRCGLSNKGKKYFNRKKPSPFSKEHLEKMSIGQKNRQHYPASEETKRRLSISHLGGPGSKPYRTVQRKARGRILNSRKFKDYMNFIRLRDQNCVKCQSIENLHVDHIVPLCFLIDEVLRLFGPENLFENCMNFLPLWEYSNGRLLCINCHKKTTTFGAKALNYSSQLR